ncbi:MAG: CZB domain-containing protein [Alphaproteobacteria bacterium]|nr:CZB domain-containing protein [Alphaproteobacteria bacterium]
MLGFGKKVEYSENVVELAVEQEIDSAHIAIQLKMALDAIEKGEAFALDNLSHDIAQPIEHLAVAIKQRNEDALKRAVSLSVGASNSMAAVSLITGDVRKIESNSNSMASAIEELDASIGQISDTAKSSADKMQNADGMMATGLANVQKTNESAHVTSEAMNSMEAQTKAVSSAVNQISNFVSTIDEIAQQTNLLALNATIEAARAGDAGKGFAVVAAEVKSLSTATQKATEDINQQITSLHNDVQQLLQSFEAANGSVVNTQQLTEETENNIQEIAAIVSETAGGMADIANVLSEQTEATRELAVGVNKIADSGVKASKMADEVIASIKGSEQIIEQLFAALDGRNIENYVLNRAKSDHYLWKKNLAEMLVGLNNLKHNELADHHSCRLGKWCDAISDDRIANHPAFKQLEAPHKQVHDFGKLAAAEFAKGNNDASHEAFANMQQASNKVVEILDSLIRG